MLLSSPAISQEHIGVARFHVGLKRFGPGLLLRDILNGNDEQIRTVIDIIVTAKPDILLLTQFDFGQHALNAFTDALAQAGASFLFSYSTAPNSGVASGRDLDGDGYFGDATDAEGYGEFSGQGGMPIVSRFPIDEIAARDFSAYLWRDLPGARPPNAQDENSANNVQRLSSVAHWDVPVSPPDGSKLHLLAYHATTPAFDGPEDRNGLRNHDETLFSLNYLDGKLAQKAPKKRYIVIGDANLDPVDGQGKHLAIQALLDSGHTTHPKPRSDYSKAAAAKQGGVNITRLGDPALDTAVWRDTKGPGNLRVDYVLPSVDLKVTDVGIVWPTPEKLAELSDDRGRAINWHGLVWVDIAR